MPALLLQQPLPHRPQSAKPRWSHAPRDRWGTRARPTPHAAEIRSNQHRLAYGRRRRSALRAPRVHQEASVAQVPDPQKEPRYARNPHRSHSVLRVLMPTHPRHFRNYLQSPSCALLLGAAPRRQPDRDQSHLRDEAHAHETLPLPQACSMLPRCAWKHRRARVPSPLPSKHRDRTTSMRLTRGRDAPIDARWHASASLRREARQLR